MEARLRTLNPDPKAHLFPDHAEAHDIHLQINEAFCKYLQQYVRISLNLDN